MKKMDQDEKKIEERKIRALEENTREMLDLKLTLAHFNKLIGPELEKTDAIQAVQKRRDDFVAKMEARFGPQGN
tara:strand:- start:29 stop:250 length:222 start_codon:yes stop_codon:yes gene_type:complete